MACLLLLVLPPGLALAQQSRPAQPVVPAPVPEAPPPPYDPELLKLSEAMGSMAFLRVLCTGAEEPVWRERMSALMDAEARSSARRERLAAAYNRGYRSYALVYRNCTESAQEALVRLAREGEALSRTLAGRFGG